MSKNELSLPWSASPSQILNLTSYMFSLIMIGLIIYLEPIVTSYMPEEITGDMIMQGVAVLCGFIVLRAFAKYLSIRCYVYTITDDKILVKKGILSSVTENVEVYRIKDQKIVKPFFLRLFGLGNLVLLTSDHTTPTVNISAVRNVESLFDVVQAATLKSRKQHGVREFD